jgi:hypothetical protein
MITLGLNMSMTHRRFRMNIAVTLLALCAAAATITAQSARADDVGYLVNVTLRPGYNFPNADAALSYGYGLCDQINAGVSYSQLVNTIKSDFSTRDEFQASYLISQAAQELCPAAIWQLRQSAAGYVPSR